MELYCSKCWKSHTPPAARIRVKQYRESRLTVLNSRLNFLHMIHAYVSSLCIDAGTLRIKQCGEYRLSAINGSQNPSNIVNISMNLKSNLKSLQIPSKRLEKGPFLKKIRGKKSRWTVSLTNQTSFRYNEYECHHGGRSKTYFKYWRTGFTA